MSEKPTWCLGCPLHDAPGPVFAAPVKPNRILLLGEAPGQDEVRVNKNFIGGSGRVLRKWCKATGVDDVNVEVRNAVKCRPTNPATGKDRAPTEEEIRHCSRFLSAELEVINPNLIVAIGATALYVTTGRTQISTYRGAVLDGPLRKGGVDGERIKVLAVYHPSYIMRSQELWPLAVHDFAKAKVEAQFKEIRRYPTTYFTTGSLRHSPQTIVENARRAGFITFDLEAEGIVGKKGKGLDLSTGAITVMGLASAPYTADALHWTPDVIRLCAELFADPLIEKVGQNSEGFDIPYIERRGLKFAGRSFDTLQAFHLTNSELEKNLAFIASLYTDMEDWKGPQMYKAGFEALKLGNCKDIDATTRAYLSLKQELKEMGMEDLYYNGVMPLQPVLRAMTDRGLKRDDEKAFRMATGAKVLSKQIETKLLNVIGVGVNLDSPKQLSDILYKQMGLPVQYKRDKKRGMVPTVDDNALDNLEKLTSNPIFALINKRRKINKLISTYLELDVDDASKVHPHFGSAKAASEKGKDEFGREKGSAARNGRLISWNPNFQNQPNEIRELYIPDHKDAVFIEADWSQVEWATAMVLSGEPFGLELLASGADGHSITAAECFGLSLSTVAEEDAKYNGGWGSPRFATKFIVYGLGYGRGAKDIAKQLNRPIPWVESFIHRFSTKFPVYWAWRDASARFVSKESYLANCFGRRRWWYTQQVTEVYNFLPSSTAADMMYRVLPILERQLPNGAELRLTVHDSVLIHAVKDVARLATECVRDVMQSRWDRITNASGRPDVVLQNYGRGGWYCRADVHLGLNWRECKKGNKALEKQLGVAK